MFIQSCGGGKCHYPVLVPTLMFGFPRDTHEGHSPNLHPTCKVFFRLIFHPGETFIVGLEKSSRADLNRDRWIQSPEC
jgi:hypothetical protein